MAGLCGDSGGVTGYGSAVGVRGVCITYECHLIQLLQNTGRRGTTLYGEMHSLNLNFKRMKHRLHFLL